MSKNSGNSFFAFLFGIFAGCILGLLFAPEKGAHTRDRLSFLLDKYKKKSGGTDGRAGRGQRFKGQ